MPLSISNTKLINATAFFKEKVLAEAIMGMDLEFEST
jgi:hypothetical protein